MLSKKCPPCTMEYSKGRGNGVAQTLGNWGFSNEVVSPGHELTRMQCLLDRMDALKAITKCAPCKKKCPVYRANPHSSPACRPCWFFPMRRPLVVYKNVYETLKTNDQRIIRHERNEFIPERHHCLQGTDKWYKMGASCCPQPSCAVTQVPCSRNCETPYCCYGYCA